MFPIFITVAIGMLAFWVILVVIVKQIKNKQSEKQEATHESDKPHSNSAHVSMTDEQKRRLDHLRQQQKQKSAVEQHERHQKDAHEHNHSGEEEHYEEIVGSLGEVYDEGCDDLSGVRFIAHDLAYDTTNEGKHDYAKLAKAMVLGEIINSPRFKIPYGRK